MATKFKTKSPITRLVVLYKRYLRDAYVYQGVLRDRLSNDVNQILQRPTLVAMATKIETKQTKQTPLV